jgi:hypothetical protein
LPSLTARRQVPQGRQIVQRLTTEKLTFAPMDREEERFGLQATGTVEKLFDGAVPGDLHAVVSPRRTDALQVTIDH